ncbi:response regulator [Nitrincola sp. MINF-07-Sa-05]|uniref:response regulator n=1 Tax=Nitrincola salilacus TaxID=3400273 RepID=UPI003917FBD5
MERGQRFMESLKRQTILVVDDTPENIDVLVGILKAEYQVKAATRGEKALQIVQSGSLPDLILLDIMMPDMDGYEVCRRLKADPLTRHIPVIFVTAKIQISDEIKGFELGAADYITKPISPPIVLARVQTHLALYDRNRELEAKVRQRTEQLYATQLLIIQRLGRAAEFKDNETGLHVIRMSLYTRVLALAAGMSEAEAELLMHAAPMHDIGKIGIPDAVLQKPGKLSPDEWDIMMGHAEIGAGIIGENPDSELLTLARTVALHHHEKWDGSGYPQRLKSTSIPLAARIVAIADVFDALTTRRPYKEPWSVERAIAYLEDNAGKHFDPDLIPLFLKSLPQIMAIREAYAENTEYNQTGIERERR